MLQSLSPTNASERDSDGGFSLVEIMVALAIFLVASGAVLGLIMVSLSTIRSNADRVYAASLARAELNAIRLLPADQIPIGTQDPREVSTDAGDFTISVTTDWEPLPQDVIALCEGLDDGGNIPGGRAYVSARVSVTGGELSGPQIVQALIYPNDFGSSDAGGEAAKTGTMTISVTDVEGNPVSPEGYLELNGVSTNWTAADGCAFVPGLATSADWKVTLPVPPGWEYVLDNNFEEESKPEQTQAKVVDALLNTPVNFVVAKPGEVKFSVSDELSYACEGCVEIRRADQGSATESRFVDPGEELSGLWPGTYTAWLRPCKDSVDGTVASTVVGQGETEFVTIDVPKVQVYATPGSSVTARYTSAACDPDGIETTPIDFPAPGSETFSTNLVETITVEEEVTDGEGNTTTETTTTVANYFVPREVQNLTSGVWTFSDETNSNSSKVRIDDSLPVCAVVVGDFPEDEGSETSFTPDLTIEEAEAFRSEIGVTADTELTAPILPPSMEVPLCPAAS